MYKLIRSVLFLFDAETAHHLALNSLKWIFKIPGTKYISKRIFLINDPFEFLGLKFTNRVGLAAGLDKNAAYLNELSALGFGFVEIGTVTPLPQSGNPKPRLFRLKKDECLINRMGFNNDGADAIAKRLAKRPKNLIVGGNIGKNKITPNHQASNDYEICFNKLYHLVDYFVVNVSSPNTPNLRELQDKKPLEEILTRLVNSRKLYLEKGFGSKPILLKIAPDMTESQLDDIVDLVKTCGIDGVVATNTTIMRTNLITPKESIEKIGAGGLSGKVLSQRSTEVIHYISQKSNNTIPIIGVGGIYNTKTALEKINAGASLVQLYTGFVYYGPGLVKKVAKSIKKQFYAGN
ncbi:MAG: quinone-dependent dihydroorotate dehydrogenase [Bacteroidia bacterium]